VAKCNLPHRREQHHGGNYDHEQHVSNYFLDLDKHKCNMCKLHLPVRIRRKLWTIEFYISLSG